MAATSQQQPFQHNNNNNNGSNNTEFNRQEIQTAIAKAVELRALHAALTQGNSPNPSPGPNNARFPSPSSASHFSAQDYPVFTPSYEDEPHQNPTKSRTVSESWDENGIEGGNIIESTIVQDYKEKSSSRKVLPFGFSTNLNQESHMCPIDDTKSVTGSCANHITVLQTSPNEYFKSRRRNSLDDFKPLSSCNRCKPALITSEFDNTKNNNRSSNIVVPLTDSHASFQTQHKSKGMISWLFPKFKRKHKNKNESFSPNRTESEEVSQILNKDMGIMSIEMLKRELMEAHESRDSAILEVSEMRSSFGELKQKLEYLEGYCEELKKALKQAMQAKESPLCDEKVGIPFDGNGENPMMPVNEDVMVEGFLQIVSESRLSVKHFCKILISQIEENDQTLIENLNLLLQPYKLSLNSKYSKAVLYHFEAFINNSLYQDFENSVFQKNGSAKFLDPRQDRRAQFSSYVALRNLSWNEVLKKGTKYYSEEFSKFCDQKMSCIITTLNWLRPWPEPLLQAFFVAAKCVWLLHLLAFSFTPTLGILRVEENRSFDGYYMEDLLTDRQRSQGPSKVKIMVMPGFYVQDKVLRCKVICRHKSKY
ncbi:IRK-interacting protein-like [Trifolium pratense]|uniref:IRK-interacting protein-like n=1 Tax=Trifolium pratense TaxID=57577 RepID=UPI001E696AAA|nr:IRK-interacting protein-like [Trifolium pratense]